MYNSRRSGGLEEMQEAQKRASQSKKTSRKHVPASLEESAADIAFGPAPNDARKWHRRTLNLCVELAGLPALATVIASFFYPDNQSVLSICAIVALLLAIGLRFFPNVHEEHAVTLVLPWLIVVGMAAVLYAVLWRNPNKSSKLAKDWLKWQKRVEASAAKCKDEKGKDLDICIVRDFGPVLNERPGKSDNEALNRLASGVMAGQVLLANDAVRTELKARLSVDDRFIGTGTSEPIGITNSAEAKVPEYLVPNLLISDKQVWVWELTPEQYLEGKPLWEHSLKEVLMKVSQTQDNPNNFKTAWESWIEKEHLNSPDAPVLVRFASLDPTARPLGPNDHPKDYVPRPSACIGKPSATRVFMNTLAPLLEEPLQTASRNSGYTEAARHSNNVRLYVWVWVPAYPGEVTQATWENVLNNMTTWIQGVSCEQPPGGAPPQPAVAGSPAS
jgi:hypothetical protein